MSRVLLVPEPGQLVDVRHRRLRLAYEEWADNQAGSRPDPAIHTQWLCFVLDEVLDIRSDALLEGQQIPSDLCYEAREYGETLRPQLAVRSPFEPKVRLLIQQYPRGQKLEKVLPEARWKASPATRMMELLRASDVRLGLVTNGEHWMLIDAPPNETTGYYSWYSTLWLEEPLTLRAFRSLLGMERFFNVPPDETLEAQCISRSKGMCSRGRCFNAVFSGVGTAIYAVQRFIAVYPMNPGHRRGDAVHGDESPDAIKSGPYVVEGLFDG